MEENGQGKSIKYFDILKKSKFKQAVTEVQSQNQATKENKTAELNDKPSKVDNINNVTLTAESKSHN